jgi:CRISPR-associated protein (TIGR03984 family)
MSANGLTLQKITRSSIEKMTIQQGVQERILREFPTSATIVAYFVHEVLTGLVCDGNIVFSNQCETIDETHLIMLRVFDPDKELFLRKSENKFIGRIRIDGQDKGDACEYVEADQILVGACAKAKDGFTILKENQSLKQGLPVPGEFSFDTEDSLSSQPEKRLAIRTRNYIGYNEMFHAEYVDSRFVKFCLVSKRGK